MAKQIKPAGESSVDDLTVTADDLETMGVVSGSEVMTGKVPTQGPRNKRAPKVLSEEEQAALEEMGSAAKEVPFGLPEESDEWPDWVVVPPGLRVVAGTLVGALLFEADTCTNPDLGDHHCMVWPLTDKEQALAYRRTNGLMERAISELARGAIRTCDGHKVQWPGGTGAPGDIQAFWEAIGSKGRSMLIEWYVNAHSFTKEERVRFFGRCIATKRAG